MNRLSNVDGEGLIIIAVQGQDINVAKVSRRACVGLLEHGRAPGNAGIAILETGVCSLSQHSTVLAVLASYHGCAVVGANAGGYN